MKKLLIIIFGIIFISCGQNGTTYPDGNANNNWNGYHLKIASDILMETAMVSIHLL